ncbi:MAG: hypothetical protein QG580_276 [Patescibacteria group bacterium]|nr:hypothetical protein [Patescibacteria group bacterium]
MYVEVFIFAAGQGLEPQYPGPKPGVLPLDEPAISLLTRKLITDNIVP